MRKNSYDKILEDEPKKQYLSLAFFFFSLDFCLHHLDWLFTTPKSSMPLLDVEVDQFSADIINRKKKEVKKNLDGSTIIFSGKLLYSPRL